MTYKKWFKSGLKLEGVAQKCRPFNVFSCSLDAPKEWERVKKGSWAKRCLKRDMKSNENDEY